MPGSDFSLAVDLILAAVGVVGGIYAFRAFRLFQGDVMQWTVGSVAVAFFALGVAGAVDFAISVTGGTPEPFVRVTSIAVIVLVTAGLYVLIRWGRQTMARGTEP